MNNQFVPSDGMRQYYIVATKSRYFFYTVNIHKIEWRYLSYNDGCHVPLLVSELPKWDGWPDKELVPVSIGEAARILNLMVRHEDKSYSNISCDREVSVLMEHQRRLINLDLCRKRVPQKVFEERIEKSLNHYDHELQLQMDVLEFPFTCQWRRSEFAK